MQSKAALLISMVVMIAIGIFLFVDTLRVMQPLEENSKAYVRTLME